MELVDELAQSHDPQYRRDKHADSGNSNGVVHTALFMAPNAIPRADAFRRAVVESPRKNELQRPFWQPERFHG